MYAVIDAWKKSSVKRNCEAAFREASIYPIDPDNTVLRRSDVRESAPQDTDAPCKGININAQEITTPAKRIEIFSKYFFPVHDVSQIPLVDENMIIARQNSYSSEKLLSNFPVSLMEVKAPPGMTWSAAIIQQ